MQTLDSLNTGGARQPSSQLRFAADALTPSPVARQRVARGPLLMSAALLILGAAAIHLSGAPQQLPRSIILAAGLCLIGLVQAAGAVALLGIARRPVARARPRFCAGSGFVGGGAPRVALP